VYPRFIILLFTSVVLTSIYYESHYAEKAEGRERLRIERPAIDEAVVRLEINNSLCSGFVVAKDLIATAAHCVARKTPITHALVNFLDGTDVPFKVVAKGSVQAGHDWALVSADTREIVPIPFNIALPTPGMVVASVGHPHGVIEQWMTFGMVMQVGKVIILAEINYPGESGSVIMDQGGNAIGILSAVNLQTPVAYITPIEILASKMYELGYTQ